MWLGQSVAEATERVEQINRRTSLRIGGTLTAVFALPACGTGDDGAASSEQAERGAFPDSVFAELVAMGVEDQELRQDLTPARMQDSAFRRRIARGDSARSERLREIVAEYGWPDRSAAGEEAADAAFLILQHSPHHDFQSRMVQEIEALAEEGDVSGQQAALLIDRVRMHEGRPQLYGTQFEQEDDRLVLYPVADADSLDERRAAIGLPSMERYVELMEEAYSVPVVRDGEGTPP